MESSIVLIGLVLLIVWMAVLSYFYYRLHHHYYALTAHTDSKNLQAMLEQLFTDSHKIKKDIALLGEQYAKIEDESRFHIQKIGLLRFNPFKDTGGDQSFIVALIDANDTGLVISGLYSRSGTRWYAKRILEGKGTDHELSEDEKKAIRMAKSTG